MRWHSFTKTIYRIMAALFVLMLVTAIVRSCFTGDPLSIRSYTVVRGH